MINQHPSPLSDLLQDRAATTWPEVRAFAEPPERGGWSDASSVQRLADAALSDRSPTDVR